MSHQNNIKRYKKTQMNFEKLLAQRVAENSKSIRVILFRVCPSVPSYFMFALLFIPSLNALRSYRFVSLYLVAILFGGNNIKHPARFTYRSS